MDTFDNSTLSPLINDTTYDPRFSLLSFTSIYGDDTQITFDDLQYFINSVTTSGILFGVRFGSSFITMVIMWLVSKKRDTPIFIINQFALFFIMMHDIFEFAYLFSNLGSAAFSLTGFSAFITRNNIHLYGAINIFQVLIVTTIEISLVYQIKVILGATNFKKKGYYRTIILGASLLGLATVAMYFVTAITGMITMYADINNANASYFNVSAILLTSSINLITIILIIKLVLAIRSRRYLGLKQFSSFHILLIMFSQTLIIPSILLVLSYSLKSNRGTDKLFSIGTLLAVLSLPLSSLWASSTNNQPKPELERTYGYPNSSDESFDYNQKLNDQGKNWFSRIFPFISSNISHKTNNANVNGSSVSFAEYSDGKSNTDDLMSSSSFSDVEKQHYIRAMKDTLSYKNSNSLYDELTTPTTAAESEARKFWTENISFGSEYVTPRYDKSKSSLSNFVSNSIKRTDSDVDEGFLKVKKLEFKKTGDN